MSNRKIRFDRLRKVVQALREVPREQKSKFTMECYIHACGTPACALGHFAARRDLQSVFRINKFKNWNGMLMASAVYRGNPALLDSGWEYFGLTGTQTDELFGPRGCGNAKTPIQAARYIERFIAKHEKESTK